MMEKGGAGRGTGQPCMVRDSGAWSNQPSLTLPHTHSYLQGVGERATLHGARQRGLEQPALPHTSPHPFIHTCRMGLTCAASERCSDDSSWGIQVNHTHLHKCGGGV